MKLKVGFSSKCFHLVVDVAEATGYPRRSRPSESQVNEGNLGRLIARLASITINLYNVYITYAQQVPIHARNNARSRQVRMHTF